jgi:hypothetical protein
MAVSMGIASASSAAREGPVKARENTKSATPTATAAPAMVLLLLGPSGGEADGGGGGDGEAGVAASGSARASRLGRLRAARVAAPRRGACVRVVRADTRACAGRAWHHAGGAPQAARHAKAGAVLARRGVAGGGRRRVLRSVRLRGCSAACERARRGSGGTPGRHDAFASRQQRTEHHTERDGLFCGVGPFPLVWFGTATTAHREI